MFSIHFLPVQQNYRPFDRCMNGGLCRDIAYLDAYTRNGLFSSRDNSSISVLSVRMSCALSDVCSIIPQCSVAATPEDCPEKRAGGTCSQRRAGVFKVLDKNIVLHVGPDAQDALSCMIRADGIIMGCSSFGQIAGILSAGISMFSMECEGARTTPSYKTIPPIAIAERGHLWVPIAGSWRDPALFSTTLFRRALEIYISRGRLDE